ncbi:ABC transporter, substrate-binding protein, aliphatic sulfonates family [Clostridium aceticum]|uniref:ABC transporter, substrate-binding protein, aliphatic sulfonates family n=1 Tax=Clostridium aceticum TaxID=84022 RepID=A0A0D8IAW0_9CLOT|nr:NrtA/SsuA/CpmA family ABC transporter substrate-binding protein [Clostridium aceticum]AKL96432.1 ABC transporter, substrate-binding protein, aliphatic sulfonates family [Clostridium aceticum]KJF27393.1 ABC transporter substrate-binding protein [Clostridium aceticum]
MKVLRKNQRVISIIMMSFMALFFLSGCSSKEPAGVNTEVEVVDKINITYVKAPLNVPSIVQKHQGLFEEEFGEDNIEVNLLEITSGPEQTQALAAGELDFLNAVGGTSAILAAANGVDLKIISVYSRAPKAFMILTNSDEIKTAADLEGKKVGGPKGTVLHQLLITALDTNDLSEDDIEYIAMDIPSALSALTNGSIDAALLAGPAALQAIKSGAEIVTTGEGLVEGTIVVAVRGEFLRKYPDLVKRFAKVHQESLAFIQNNIEEAYRITAEETGLTIEDAKMMYEWYDFDPAIKASDIEELKVTQEFLKENGMLDKTISIEGLITVIE